MSSKTKILDLTMKNVSARLYCLAVPSNLYSEILYMMILQKILKQWRHPHKTFSQKNLVQVNSDRMALSVLRVSLKVAK